MQNIPLILILFHGLTNNNGIFYCLQSSPCLAGELFYALLTFRTNVMSLFLLRLCLVLPNQ